MTQTIVWASIGILLVIAEILSGTFFLLFFGVGALIVAGIRMAGLDNLNSEIALFALISASLIFTLRKKLLHSFYPQKDWNDEQNFIASQALEPMKQTKVQYQGSSWTAINEGAETIPEGSNVKITRKDGIKLFVKKV